jgi:hypothetical protein
MATIRSYPGMTSFFVYDRSECDSLGTGSPVDVASSSKATLL